MTGIYKIKTIKDIRQAIKSIDNQENKITDYEISKFISKVEKNIDFWIFR